ncbi:ABC-2 type transport system ATP-binding protein [Geodermatophilus pulveris]|uniref:ABC-2 type transport system ATP-binding protein n=1 Tax=Geodermatophilus pulveris TaxID=1564159 RepID=A0A239B0D4_9ACTN|nr:ABC transporter ATP-binding protein [Geodermatophilus pulveris]SNS01071.1 ABC-2 type transport system ATP-binding protein [Geodermatophilus pulveris]
MGAPTDRAVISVRDAGVRFHRGRRHRSLRDLLVRGESGPRRDGFWALHEVSFDIAPGETIGVVGRNGQGKSTLLKLIAGVMLPDRGSVTVRGGVAPLIEITGGFAGDLTVRENIALTGGLHGMSRAALRDRFDEIVDFAEIEDFLDTPYKHLSSGMKVRVAFAVVSRLEEPVILVDEVLAVGDRDFRRKCHARMDQLTAEGRTLFLVSHSEWDLRRFCRRGLYLRGGRLVADGPMDDVLAEYAAESETNAPGG